MERTVHFVGFRGDEYRSAVKIWGTPDFIHRIWDQRAWAETRSDAHAVVIFARSKDWQNRDHPAEFSFDDSAVM